VCAATYREACASHPYCAMFEPIEDQDPDPKTLEEIYRRAPVGALTVAGIATGIVFGLWLAFYLLVFLPRGILR
jgi:hypothetical protein